MPLVAEPLREELGRVGHEPALVAVVLRPLFGQLQHVLDAVGAKTLLGEAGDQLGALVVGERTTLNTAPDPVAERVPQIRAVGPEVGADRLVVVGGEEADAAVGPRFGLDGLELFGEVGAFQPWLFFGRVVDGLQQLFGGVKHRGRGAFMEHREREGERPTASVQRGDEGGDFGCAVADEGEGTRTPLREPIGPIGAAVPLLPDGACQFGDVP